MTADALSSIETALAEAGDADDGLRETVRVLAAQPEVVWAGIAFVESAGLVLGPASGAPDETRRTVVPVSYNEEVVGELRVDGRADPVLLAAVAERISAHVLLGWDTAGEAWEP